ncbi:MAG: hypothetical protein NZM40_04135 [Sphingomonadaceae bacterium]|uniref:hypothetical protein n=1 Tax=Thermaurantiacus sp. TaxID=2820283 RepID=UPI00298F302C|nr:hypothetical protein [Thermaurantiacus sp.]MCS6986614.1 hypothetical protein [Sphingomonadaceae bacterium]MDW8414125.1 hypothetical protein [Thermaurantiacus sp.]
MAEIEWWDHDDAVSLGRQLADDIAFLIGRAVAERGTALVALATAAAGTTVLDALARADVPWGAVVVVPTEDDGDRTAAAALGRRFRPLGGTVVALDQARDLNWPADVAWLVPGPGGRVAGLAPGPELARALASPHPIVRTTEGWGLSGSALRSAEALLVAVFSETERRRLEAAIDEGASARLPMGRLLAECEQAVDIHFAPAEA